MYSNKLDIASKETRLILNFLERMEIFILIRVIFIKYPNLILNLYNFFKEFTEVFKIKIFCFVFFYTYLKTI